MICPCAVYKKKKSCPILTSNRSIVQGVQVDPQDNRKRTPLHLSIIQENERIFSLLLTSKANPRLANEDGDTCLHIACCTEGRRAQ